MIRPQSLPGAMISFYRKETESYFERLNDLSSLLSPVHLWWKLPLLLPREKTHQLSPLSVSALPFQELLPQWLQTCNKPPSISRNALYWLIFSPFFFRFVSCMVFLALLFIVSLLLSWWCWWCCPWTSSILSDRMHSQALNYFLQFSKHLVFPPAISNSRAVCLAIYLTPHRPKIYTCLMYKWFKSWNYFGSRGKHLVSHGKKTILPLCPHH